MKILICHNAYQVAGGEDTVVASESLLLQHYGHDVFTWIVSNNGISSLGNAIKTGLQVNYRKASKETLQALLTTIRPDIVHVHNLFPLMTPAIYDACIEEGIAIVQTLHNFRLFCANALLMRKGKVCEKCLTGNKYHAVVHRCYRQSFTQSYAVSRMIDYHLKHQTWQDKVTRFIVLTAFARDKFIQSGLAKNSIRVKPNFLPVFDELSPPVSWGERQNHILFVGRLSEEKGIETLVEMSQLSPVTIKVAGSGPLQQLIDNQPNIEYLGFLERNHINALMKQAKVLIIPSLWYEGFPMVLLEAMMLGLPVVVSNIGGMAEIVDHKKNGLKVEPGNAQAFIQAIDELMQNEKAWQALSNNSFKKVNTVYSARANYEQLMAIYQEAMNEAA